MSESLSRSQRRIISSVMDVIAPDGFVIAGGVALVLSGVSNRPTEDLGAFSSSCDDVSIVVDRLVGELDRAGYTTEAHRNTESFARMTVRTGQWRRTELRVELGRDTQLLESVPSSIGPMLSLRELAANKVLAAFGRHEPRDLVDLAQIASVVALSDAYADAARKDPGFDADVLREMVTRTCGVRDELWPAGSDPQQVRMFVSAEILTLEQTPPTRPEPGLDPDRFRPTGPTPDTDGPELSL